jgi:hypothetical protein
VANGAEGDVLIQLVCLLITSLAAAQDSGLPEGKGRDAVENTCLECHSIRRIKAQHLDEEGWNSTIRQMIENGASINPDDVKVIVDYLTKNFGPETAKKVNVNKAAAGEIAAALGLTAEEATVIVEYRTRDGNFKDLSALEKVGNLAAKIEAKKALIEF